MFKSFGVGTGTEFCVVVSTFVIVLIVIVSWDSELDRDSVVGMIGTGEEVESVGEGV